MLLGVGVFNALLLEIWILNVKGYDI